MPTFFLLRRFLFAISIVSLPNSIWGQQIISIVSSLLLIRFITRVMPFNDQILNFIEIFNESCILLSSYLMLLFTDFITDPFTRYQVGWVYAGLVSLNLMVNWILLFSRLIRSIWIEVSRRLAMRRAKKDPIIAPNQHVVAGQMTTPIKNQTQQLLIQAMNFESTQKIEGHYQTPSMVPLQGGEPEFFNIENAVQSFERPDNSLAKDYSNLHSIRHSQEVQQQVFSSSENSVFSSSSEEKDAVPIQISDQVTVEQQRLRENEDLDKNQGELNENDDQEQDEFKVQIEERKEMASDQEYKKLQESLEIQMKLQQAILSTLAKDIDIPKEDNI